MIIYNDIAEFVSLNPVYYRFLKSISFKRDIRSDGYGRYAVDIIMSKISGNNIEDMQLRCTGAFGVSVGDINGLSGLQIKIEDVSSSQIEGAAFRVVDVEDGVFSFYCEEFFAELMQ